jgi:hypothetical protein
MMLGGCGESASLFRPALAVAGAQQAKSWELRAGGSGAIRASGEEAREPLAPVYERFTEGFDTRCSMSYGVALEGDSRR